MTDLETMAAWLRQRDGETDVAWIERLYSVLGQGRDLLDDPKADRMGDRLWKRYLAQRSEAAERDT